MSNVDPITLTVAADPRLARLVRMTASNVAMLSHMSLDRVEDVRMAAEEAFIYACSVQAGKPVTVSFEIDDAHVGITFALAEGLGEPEADSPAAYADLILGAVCDSYEKHSDPASLLLVCKADV